MPLPLRALKRLMATTLSHGGEAARSTVFKQFDCFDWRSESNWDPTFSTSKHTAGVVVAACAASAAGKATGAGHDESVVISR